MKLTETALIIFLILVSFSGTGHSKRLTAQNEFNWIGKYEFYEDGGKTAGGTKIFISHELEIEKDGDGSLKANLSANGYMTYFDLWAYVKIEGNKLSIFFQKKGDSNSMGSYLKKNDLLLVLEAKKSHDKSQILTHWKKYQPGIEKYEESGKVRFEKLESNENTSSSGNSEKDGQIRQDFKKYRYIYVGRVAKITQLPSKSIG